MGAITKRNQGIRHLRKHITHIQLTFDFDEQWREVVTECIDKLPHHNRQIFAFMMTANDLRDVSPHRKISTRP